MGIVVQFMCTSIIFQKNPLKRYGRPPSYVGGNTNGIAAIVLEIVTIASKKHAWTGSSISIWGRDATQTISWGRSIRKMVRYTERPHGAVLPENIFWQKRGKQLCTCMCKRQRPTWFACAGLLVFAIGRIAYKGTAPSPRRKHHPYSYDMKTRLCDAAQNSSSSL